MQSLQTLNGEILMALNRSGTLLRFTVLWFVGSVGSVVLGLQWGIIGVAVCYAVTAVVIEPVNAWVTARALGIPVARFFRSFSGVSQAAAIMGLAVLGARSLLVSAGVPSLGRLVLLVLLGIAVYVPACLWRAPEVTGEVTNVLGRRRPIQVGAALSSS